MIKWIQDEYKADVIALTIDIGQQVDDLEAIKQKAIKLNHKLIYGDYLPVFTRCKSLAPL